MIPDRLHHHLEKLLDCSIKQVHPASGGSINEAAKITDSNRQDFFLKWNTSAPDDMFRKEEKGLTLLGAGQSGLRLPEVISADMIDEDTGFILMEHMREGSGTEHSNRILGNRLAKLHQNTASLYGLDHDNYIGRLPQSNKKHDNWTDFFIHERLEPQLKTAIDSKRFAPKIANHFQHLYSKLPNLLPEEPASLLHGDLWGGNYFFDENGEPAIYDPAVYYGNREAELAFTHLFGGFSTAFYEAYQENFPLQPNFDERTDIYNLYPLLVHTNMFGASYASQVKSIISSF